MSGKVLVKQDSNYADEFDLRGYRVFTTNDWNNHLSDVEKLFAEKKAKVYRPQRPGEPDYRYRYSQEVTVDKYFGTNEMLTWNSFEDYKRDFTVTPISDEDAAVLERIFGDDDIGEIHMLEPDDMEDYDDE